MFAVKYVKDRISAIRRLRTTGLMKSGVDLDGGHEMTKSDRTDEGKLNEKEAKKKLGISSWDELSKDKHVEFIEILPRLNSNDFMYIAQFIPDFLVLVNTLFETVGSVAEKAIEKDQANTKAIIDELNAIQSSLAVLTKREDLSSGELMHVCDLLIEVARIHERLNNRNKEHKERRLEYIGEIIGKGLAVIGIIVVAILANKSNKSDFEG